MRERSVYEEIRSIDDLLELHDERFINALYRRLLGREPDARGHAGHLRNLRQGRAQLAVIRDIVISDEAKSKVIDLAGLEAAMNKYADRTRSPITRWRFRHHPDYGSSRWARQIRAIANQISGMEDRISMELDGLRGDLEGIGEQARTVSAGPIESRSAYRRPASAVHHIRNRGLHWRSVDLPGRANRMIARLKL